MGLFTQFIDLFGSDDSLDIEDGDQYFNISKDEFIDHLSVNNNLTPDGFYDAIDSGSLADIDHQIDGAMGNIMAKKYFLGMDADVQPEVGIGNSKIDLFVNPHSPVQLQRLEFDETGLHSSNEHFDEDFAVEVKSYSADSFSFPGKSLEFSEQIENALPITKNSLLAVTKDFLNVNPDLQSEIINSVEMAGGKVVLLPYYKYTIDDTFQDNLTQFT